VCLFRIGSPSPRNAPSIRSSAPSTFREQLYSNAKVEQWDKAQNFGVNFFPRTRVSFLRRAEKLFLSAKKVRPEKAAVLPPFLTSTLP
jgi:hypothetical protein